MSDKRKIKKRRSLAKSAHARPVPPETCDKTAISPTVIGDRIFTRRSVSRRGLHGLYGLRVSLRFSYDWEAPLFIPNVAFHAPAALESYAVLRPNYPRFDYLTTNRMTRFVIDLTVALVAVKNVMRSQLTAVDLSTHYAVVFSYSNVDNLCYC